MNTDYVLAQDGGREALQLAWLQGHGELEAGKMQRASLGGRLTAESTSGSGRVLYKGTMRTANEVGTQLIELNAKATNTDAVLKTVLQGSDRVRAYVDTETARIFFSDRAEDVFGTILHEDYHWYNSLDAEGAQALQQHALEFLAKSEGFEGIDEMIRGKLSDYAQQGLSYEEAAEELVADAWRGIFSDEASFKRWVESSAGRLKRTQQGRQHPQGDDQGEGAFERHREPRKGSAGKRPGEQGRSESTAPCGGRKAGAAGRILCPCGEGYGQPARRKRKRRSP